jgi:hypothetical protein
MALEHFIVAEPDENRQSRLPDSSGKDAGFYRYIYDLTMRKKALIFTNSRGETESITANALGHRLIISRGPMRADLLLAWRESSYWKLLVLFSVP